MQVPTPDSRGFACPIHKRALGPGLFCADCAKQFPTANRIPVLINDANSVFRSEDYLRQEGYRGASAYAGALDKRRGPRQLYRRAMARLTEASPPRRAFDAGDAIRRVAAAVPNPRVLVIGAGDTEFDGDVVYTDVAFGAKVNCIADAHDLPFTDQSFDACVAVAVLEHVVDPFRCVDEIRRVLKPGGYVYAETPFMQPVHMGAHDFTRFSYLGHRRLFRHFEQIEAGMVGGPGVSAGQHLRYAIASLSDSAMLRKWLKLIGMLLAYPLRWLDYACHGKAAAYDSASAFYFFGRLAAKPLPDRELLALYRGG
jgi:SAM-dependent methyltransferase